MQIPQPLSSLFAHFPLHTWPPILAGPEKKQLAAPTIWVHPSSDIDSPLLSGDVECLKWQAYLALRGLKNIQVRTDISAQGAIDGRLPNLHVALPETPEKSDPPTRLVMDNSTHLLAAHNIPGWVDAQLNQDSLEYPLEGYKDEAAKDESRAWVTLLEGPVHAALVLSTQPTLASSLKTFFLTPNVYAAPPPAPAPALTSQLRSILVPPPPPQTGLTSIPFSLFPEWGTRVDRKSVMAKYSEAIAALSERLGTDKWFLGSESPTPLDALAFAYLHCILSSTPEVRTELTKRVNLVAWEWKVRGMVRASFVKSS
ncbi:hypothetical protein V5O48_016153 [Marasmius crinis-equi]|uniref:Metaxin glutathione S-transferase domain-containing protein n=1 Tax=Marasmius crinis-equi TaxID=585013 RepID=A0ABR3ESK5_9AGAR